MNDELNADFETPDDPDDGPQGRPLEAALAKQANDAIARGANPQAVSDRLTTLVNHVRSNDTLRNDAESAMAKGADAAAVATRYSTYALSNATPSAAPKESDGLQAAFQSGALAKKVAEGKARDLAKSGLAYLPSASRGGRGPARDATPGDQTSTALKRAETASQVLGTSVAPLNAVRYLGLPVGPALTTGGAVVGQALTGQTPDWKQAYRQVAAAEKSAPTALTLPAALVGGAASMALPGNAKMLSTGPGVAASGAISALTDLNPDKNLMYRVMEAPFAAAFDYGLGKGINYVAGTDMAASAAGKIAELAKKMGAKSPTLDALTQFAKLTPAERDAVRRASTAQARDVKEGNAPVAPLPTAPALEGQPTAMGVDIAGPNMLAQARGAAQSTGGRTAFEGPFAAREEAAVPSITSGTEDAMRKLQQLKQSRGATAVVDKEAAVQPTTGIPIAITPEMQEIFDTPTGRRVVNAAMRSRRNMPMRPLPATQSVNAAGEQVLSEMPDEETLHIMTQILGHAAGMEGKQPNPTGKAAIDARSAKWMREQLQEQLGPEFQTFIANYRNASRPIRALNIGRTPGQLNPTMPEGGSKVPKSLSDIRAEMKTMTPAELGALQTGKQFDIASRLNTGTLSPEQIAKSMTNPGSPLAQEMEIAGGPMAGRAQNWASALERQRQVMPSRGPTATEEAGPPLIDNLATTTKWLTRNFAKAGLGSASEKAKATQSLRDQAFARLLTQSPDALLQSIAAQGARQQSRKLGSNVAANTTLDYLRGLFQ